MAKTATRQSPAEPRPALPPDNPTPRVKPTRNDKPTPRNEPTHNHKPTRDTRDDPSANPDADENQPDTAPHKDVEKLQRKLKR